MRRGFSNRLVLAGLVALAALQLGALVLSATRARGARVIRPPDLVIGEAVRMIPGRDSLEQPMTLQLRGQARPWTVLLAFSPTCAWCDSVAPRWQSWTQGHDTRLRVLGVVGGEASAALGYSHAHGWRLDGLVVVDSAMTGALGRRLTRKTPWLFLFDSAGVLRYSGHGSEVGMVDSLAGVLR